MPDSNDVLNNENLAILNELELNRANELVLFKQATNNFEQDEIGQYFSAISNEAKLRGLPHGWLIFGVDGVTGKIIGTNYSDKSGLLRLKQNISQNTSSSISFFDILEVYKTVGEEIFRLIMFKIPAAATFVPTDWQGHYYSLAGESIIPLSFDKLDKIRGRSLEDWSASVIPDSGTRFLDPEAIKIARDNYKIKQNSELGDAEIDGVSDEAFLAGLGLVVDGRLTNAAMVLLGSPHHTRILDYSPHLRWRLFESDDSVIDYEHFCIPFINIVQKISNKIRNLTYRYIPDGSSTFPLQVARYDDYVLHELINNAIAHRDYTKGPYIYIDEYENMIRITNFGTFLPGDVQQLLTINYDTSNHRNKLLYESMVKLNMIDITHRGIPNIYKIMQNRYFPMPDYQLDNPDQVTVRIYGTILNDNYTNLLFKRPNLSLEDVFLIDRVQKLLPLTKDQCQYLRSLGVIKGRAPKLFIHLQSPSPRRSGPDGREARVLG